MPGWEPWTSVVCRRAGHVLESPSPIPETHPPAGWSGLPGENLPSYPCLVGRDLEKCEVTDLISVLRSVNNDHSDTSNVLHLHDASVQELSSHWSALSKLGQLFLEITVCDSVTCLVLLNWSKSDIQRLNFPEMQLLALWTGIKLQRQTWIQLLQCCTCAMFFRSSQNVQSQTSWLAALSPWWRAHSRVWRERESVSAASHNPNLNLKNPTVGILAKRNFWTPLGQLESWNPCVDCPWQISDCVHHGPRTWMSEQDDESQTALNFTKMLTRWRRLDNKTTTGNLIWLNQDPQ